MDSVWDCLFNTRVRKAPLPAKRSHGRERVKVWMLFFSDEDGVICTIHYKPLHFNRVFHYKHGGFIRWIPSNSIKSLDGCFQPKIGGVLAPPNGWFINNGWKTLWTNGMIWGVYHPYFWFNTHIYTIYIQYRNIISTEREREIAIYIAIRNIVAGFFSPKKVVAQSPAVCWTPFESCPIGTQGSVQWL